MKANYFAWTIKPLGIQVLIYHQTIHFLLAVINDVYVVKF